MSAEQAAAQAAVAAASTPQQQPQGTPQQTATTPASVSNSSGDQLVCQWQSCGERLPSAEQLYVSEPWMLPNGIAICPRFIINLGNNKHIIPLPSSAILKLAKLTRL